MYYSSLSIFFELKMFLISSFLFTTALKSASMLTADSSPVSFFVTQRYPPGALSHNRASGSRLPLVLNISFSEMEVMDSFSSIVLESRIIIGSRRFSRSLT